MKIFSFSLFSDQTNVIEVKIYYATKKKKKKNLTPNNVTLH